MERKEASEFLGVSLRTLDRLAAEGRLRKGRGLKKTRPVVLFDRAELESLKAELGGDRAERKVFRRLNMDVKDSVGFRLDPHYIRRLSERAAALGLSPGEMARKLVIESLEDTRVEQFKEEVSMLREGLAHAFYALLVMKLGVAEGEAEEFVNANIRMR